LFSIFFWVEKRKEKEKKSEVVMLLCMYVCMYVWVVMNDDGDEWLWDWEY
jgi:hypothetical protein